MCEISVIVPVYNAEAYLKQCIDSILCQTYSNFELVLVDDGSTDRSGEICGEYAKMDKRVRVFRQKNAGQSVARNLGVKQAVAEWIVFVDSDDMIHPNMLEVLFGGIKKHNCKIAACGAYEAVEVPDVFWNGPRGTFDEIHTDEDGMIQAKAYDNYCFWIVWGKVIHRSVVEKMPFTEGRIYEDNAIVPQWLHNAKNIIITADKLYFYRINPEGTTKTEFSLKKLDYLWALECQLHFFQENKMDRLFEMAARQYIVALSQFALKYTEGEITEEIYQQLRKEYLHFRKTESKNLILTQREYELTLCAFYPWFYKVRSLLCASICAIKQDGVAEFAKKAFRYIRRENK